MPVWPSCFWSTWPIGSGATHEVAGADDADVLHGDAAVGQRAQHGLGRQVDHVLVRVLAELGHVDARGPTRSSDADAIALNLPRVRSRSRRLRCRSSSVPITSVARRTFMPVLTCSGSGVTLTRLARTLVPSQSTTAATKGTGIPGAAKVTMVKVRTSPVVAMSTFLNSVPVAAGAGVAAVEEPGPARGALVGHQVRVVPQHQVVDQRNLLRHHSPQARVENTVLKIACSLYRSARG